jgi:F-box and leucine-rich repeat protein 2/20
MSVAGCNLMTDTGFNALCRACPDLHYMDLEECVHITDATLVNIATFNQKMERLCLSYCELVTDVGIEHLAHSIAATSGSLKVLELDNCPLITDSALDALQECPSLQRIDLYDCQQVTRGGIRRLKLQLKNAKIHAYFAPITPPPSNQGPRQRICRCCSIL